MSVTQTWHQKQRVQVITVINKTLWIINSNLMNSNYENMHYQ